MTTLENSSFLKDKEGLLTNNQHVNSHRVIAIFICQFFDTNTTVGCIDLLKKVGKDKRYKYHTSFHFLSSSLLRGFNSPC